MNAHVSTSASTGSAIAFQKRIAAQPVTTRQVLLGWGLATVAGWLISLSFAAVFSTPDTTYMPVFGPHFLPSGWPLMAIFSGIGFFSSTVQAWWLRKWHQEYYLWLAATTIGAFLGALWIGNWDGMGEITWSTYPYYTLIPIAVAQAIVIHRLFDNGGWLWLFFRMVVTAVLSVAAGFFSAIYSHDSLIAAVLLFSINLGIPSGIIGGLVISKVLKRYVKTIGIAFPSAVDK